MNSAKLKETIANIVKEESEYQIFFRKALEKAGKSITDMNDEEKKAFFNKIDATWDGKGEKNEGNTFGAERAKAIAAGNDSFEVDGKSYKVSGVDAEDKKNAEEFTNESVNEGRKSKDSSGVRYVNAIYNNTNAIVKLVMDEKKDPKEVVDTMGPVLINAIKATLAHNYKPNSQPAYTLKRDLQRLGDLSNQQRIDVFKKGLKELLAVATELVKRPSQVGVKKLEERFRKLWNNEYGANIGLNGQGPHENTIIESVNEAKFKVLASFGGYDLIEAPTEKDMIISKNGKKVGKLTKISKYLKDDIKSFINMVKSGKLGESVNEGVSPADMDKIKGAVEAASSFMSVGSELKKLGMKYTFATEPLPIYIIQPTPNNKVAIVNKKYATKPDFVVGDIAVGIMEGKLNEEEIKWDAVQNAIINFLKMNTKILDKRVQAKDTNGVKGGLKSIISGLVNAQRNLKLESVNEAGYTVKAKNPYQFLNGVVAVLGAYLRDEELGPKGKRELQNILKSLEYMRMYFYANMTESAESVNEVDTKKANLLRNSMPGYVGPKFAKKASDEDLLAMADLKDEHARIYNRYLKDINDKISKLQKKYNIKESVNEIKKGSIVMPYAMDKYGEFIVDKVFKNKSGETSYTGKFKKSGESREFILHSKDKVVKESVNEDMETQLQKIASLTGLHAQAIKQFGFLQGLNFTKILKFIEKGKLKDRMDFVTAVVGNPGNPIQKKMIKMFQESVNEERDSNLFYVLYQKKDGKFSKPQAAGYKSREDAEKFAKSLNNHSTMILDKNDWSGVKGVKVTNESVNELKKLPSGNFSIKKGYNTFADYEKNAKVGDTILRYDKRGQMIKTFVNGSELNKNAEKYLDKVNGIIGGVVYLTKKGMTGVAQVPDYEKKDIGVLVLESKSVTEAIAVGKIVKVVDNPHWEASLGKKGPFKRKVKMIDGDNVFFTDGSNSSMKYVKESVESVNEGRAFINAARKAKSEGKTEFEFNGKKYPITLKEGTLNEMNPQFNKKVKMLLDKELKDLRKGGGNHLFAVMHILMGALTDANFHSESKKVPALFGSKAKYEGDPMAEKDLIQMYQYDLGTDIANICKWDGKDIVDAIGFYVSMTVGRPMGEKIENLIL